MMNTRAIEDFLATTAMLWRQRTDDDTTERPAPTHDLGVTLEAWKKRRDARIADMRGPLASPRCSPPALRPGIRLDFELMRQARVLPRARHGDDTVDLRIGERIVRVRLDTHEVISVI